MKKSTMQTPLMNQSQESFHGARSDATSPPSAAARPRAARVALRAVKQQ